MHKGTPHIPYVEGNDQGRHRVFRDTDPDDGVPEEEKHSARVLVWMVGAASVGLVAFVVGKAVGLW